MFHYLNSNAHSEEWGGMGGKFTRLHSTCSPTPLQSRSTYSLRKSLLVNIPEPAELEKSLRFGFPNWTQKSSIYSNKIFQVLQYFISTSIRRSISSNLYSYSHIRLILIEYL